MIDDRSLTFPAGDPSFIRSLCDRRFGIGADGIILIRDHGTLDFRMVYFNADGKEGSMCGNGGRCAAAYAYHLGLAGEQPVFEAVDGIHEAVLLDRNNIRLKMQDVRKITEKKGHFLLDTGSPHYVRFFKNLDELDVSREGRLVRYSQEFIREGINVNFVQYDKDELYVRTYERGVEDETYSCGTGVVAAAIAAALRHTSVKYTFRIRTRGGTLRVGFDRNSPSEFTDIYLEGPATYVFKGNYPADI